MINKFMAPMGFIISIFVIVMATGAGTPVLAQTLSATQKLVQSGSYDQAVQMGVEMNTAESLSLASEALAKQIMMGEADQPKARAEMARDLAREALKRDPNHQNARLQFVVTDGFVARYTGDVSAWFKKLPQKSLEHIQNYRTDFPDDPRGDALMGAWHLEIVRKAGEESALRWFGARADYGKAFFEKALNQEPDDPIMNVNFAFALIALVEEENNSTSQNLRRARILMEAALSVSSMDDFTRNMQAKASRALSLYDNPNELIAFVEAFFEGREP